MSLIVESEAPHYDEMAKVVEMYVQRVPVEKIMRERNLKRHEVKAFIKEFVESTRGMDILKDRVEELIASTDTHYSLLINKAYEIVEEVDRLANSDKETMTRSQMLSQKRAAIDLIAKLEKDRIDMLQKSGILEAADASDLLEQLEEDKAHLFEILEEELCQDCKLAVARRYATDNGTVVVINTE